MGSELLVDAGDQLTELGDGLLLNVGKAGMEQFVNGTFHEGT
jgi:hypothetical protein